MKGFIVFILFLLILSGYSCGNGYSISNDSFNDENVNASLILKNKIKLFNDSLAFSYYNLEKIDSDSILVFQHPLLNLSLFDTQGNFIREIARKGNMKEDFRAEFILPLWGKNGQLYVVEEGNVTRLSVFDKGLNYLTSINLSQFLESSFVVPLISNASIEIVDPSKDQIKLALPIASTIYSLNDPKFYETDNFIALFTIEGNQVIDLEFKAPIIENLTIKDGISKNRRSWAYITPIYLKQNGINYLKFRFDDDLYSFDSSWNFLDIVKFEDHFEYPNFSVDLLDMDDPIQKSKIDYKIKYMNKFYQSGYIKGEKIFMLFNKPPSSISKIPESFGDDWNYSPEMALLVKDLISGDEYIADLPNTLSPWGEIFVDDKGLIYLIDNPKNGEELYINVFEISLN
ncbi:NHL repeat-containing protein [Algoriphagus boritolerans]|uniref:DUF4221 domain-containing protein n=2 Tax=Algoriphagus TaxID=246875 RepID=A0A1H5T5U0_9BACT|nr:hypothetical protein [Algoriphagus boritolerans]SEF58170.1 hypothetical protein SAMN03080598_00710 [Algoriphagus boritolerans DSM 17298 = JCM 18970]